MLSKGVREACVRRWEEVQEEEETEKVGGGRRRRRTWSSRAWIPVVLPLAYV